MLGIVVYGTNVALTTSRIPFENKHCNNVWLNVSKTR